MKNISEFHYIERLLSDKNISDRPLDQICDPDPNDFDADLYCDNYPDVFEAIKSGQIDSALDHWLTQGFHEEETGIRNAAWRRPVTSTQIRRLVTLTPLDMIRLWAGEPLETLARFDSPILNSWYKLYRQVQAFCYAPRISVLLPVYDVSPKWLESAIESVVWQIYPHWELCIVDDCSSNNEVRNVIRYWADREPRIKALFRDTNGHISAASNDALSMSTGEFVAFLDHDDELTVDALVYVVAAINNTPDVDYLYSDEDKVDESGAHFGRFFKPAWSPELLLSCGYTTHLSVYRKRLLDEIGGFRSAFDGAQDYDLILRASEVTDRIVHIPHVLYHWRIIPGSTASSTDAKSYALPNAKHALADHLDRTGEVADVCDGPLPGHTRVTFTLRTFPLVSIVIPTAGKTLDVRGGAD